MQLILKVLLWIASLGVLAALLLPFMYGRLFTALSGFLDDSEITMQKMLGLSYVFYFGFPLLALLILSVWGIRRFRKNRSFFMPESWGSLDYLIPFCYGVSLFVFAVLYPIWNGNDHFQGKRLFYAGIRELADERPVVLIGDDLSGAACYLGQFGKVKLEQYRLIPDDPDMQQALEDRLLEAGNDGAVIAVACQTLNRLPENLQQQLSWPSDPGSLKMTEHGFYKESMSLSDLWKQCPEKTDQKCYNTLVFIKIFPGKSH
jgi:hypothetical protein